MSKPIITRRAVAMQCMKEGMELVANFENGELVDYEMVSATAVFGVAKRLGNSLLKKGLVVQTSTAQYDGYHGIVITSVQYVLA